jgi:hypothetical protein
MLCLCQLCMVPACDGMRMRDWCVRQRVSTTAHTCQGEPCMHLQNPVTYYPTAAATWVLM